MVKRSKGFLSKTTKMLKKDRKLTIREFMKKLNIGDKVTISIKPIYSGMPHRRYNGISGEIIGKRGNSYLVKIKNGDAEKTLIINPIHLEKN